MTNEACKTKGGGGNKTENNVYFLRNHSTSGFFYALHSYMSQCYIFLHFFPRKKNAGQNCFNKNFHPILMNIN